MTDIRQAVRDVLDSLLAIPVPAEVEIESWTQFVEDRQELIDELGLLVDTSPTLVQGLLMGEFAEDLREVMERVQEGMNHIQLEMRAVTQEMETARKSAVLVHQQKRAASQPRVLLGVA